MIFRLLSLVMLTLGFPLLYFAAPYFPPLFSSSASNYDLNVSLIVGLVPGLGGLIAGWQWRWLGAFFAPLYLLSSLVTMQIEASRWSTPASNVPISDSVGLLFISTAGVIGFGVALIATFSSAGLATWYDSFRPDCD